VATKAQQRLTGDRSVRTLGGQVEQGAGVAGAGASNTTG
jgi:hypothetical protein